MRNFGKLLFITSATDVQHYPKLVNMGGQLLPEVAVVGRSNVGKSSLLNSLFQSKAARTSATPGKTQLINFFTVEGTLAFVDLPGYGFAKVPASVRKEWGPMIQSYLEKRETLGLILFLFDIRREPNEEDFQFLDWADHYGKDCIIVLTKTDKVNQSEKIKRKKQILEQLGCEESPCVLFSAPKNRGREELIRQILERLPP